ncbi:hypothetical protein A4X13_0g8099 [Tilletia indica]|uniref:Uncharacterized protein n=1 Tax=Tilletia indica TaxID=43049 RepID=A0A177T7U1_9BASI|nr:hypothetical protein A4X13_0g8099 [Tilletia indica]
MSGTLVAYRPEIFSALPSVDEVAKDFDTFGGITSVRPKLYPSVGAHNQASLFGLQLLHRHFDLSEDQRLVAFGRVSVALELNVLDAKSATKVKPTSWMCLPDRPGMMPYEFEFDEHDSLPEPTPAFLEDMENGLRSIGIDHMVGVSLLPEGVGAEINGEQANIVLPVHEFASSADFLEVLWALKGNPEDPAEKRCHRICGPTQTRHRKVHSNK